jgi:hypothetical protein
MATVREQLIQSAIEKVQQGATQAKAAALYGIPPSTLSVRLRGATTIKHSKIHKQRLSPSQEIFLTDWCLNEESAGRAPSRRQVTAFAQEILAEGGDLERLGARWIDRYLRRHPRVKTKNSTLLETSRVQGSTRDAYEDFYGRLRYQIDSKRILPKAITNMDEHGMQELETRAGTVIGTSLTKRALVQSSDATTWVSIIEAGTAEGRRLNPCIVFTGASLQGQWFPSELEMERDFPNWKYDATPTGWSNGDIALKWLNEIYLVETKPESPLEWRLLILDEHSSHITTKFMFLAWTHRVQLLYLPPHTSHKTQPLDRSVFSPLKNHFRQDTKSLAAFTASAPINKRRFLYCYRDASARGMCARNIISGFRETGIWPFDPSKVLDDPEAILHEEALPITPPPPEERPPSPHNIYLQTPQKSQDVRESLQKAREHVSPSNRALRSVLHKSGKALDMKNAEITSLRAQIEHLSSELEAHKPRSKKRVKESANDTFARIKDIVAAQKESEKPSKRRKSTKTIDPGPAVEQAQEVIVHGLDRLRQAEEM